MILTIKFESRDIVFTLKRNYNVPFWLDRNYAMVLYKYFTRNLLFLLQIMRCSFKWPCDIKSFKISTAYDVWFSRYRPSSLMLTTVFALVLVLINFLWGCTYLSRHGLFLRGSQYTFPGKHLTFNGWEAFISCQHMIKDICFPLLRIFFSARTLACFGWLGR